MELEVTRRETSLWVGISRGSRGNPQDRLLPLGQLSPEQRWLCQGMALSEWDSSLSQEGSYPPQHLAMSISVAPSLGAVESPGGWGL